MKVVIHVSSVADIGPAREAAEADLAEGDELEIVVAQPVAPQPRPAERQEQRPATGYAPQLR